MRLAIVAVLCLILSPVAVGQKKEPPAKVEKITAENIVVGMIGTIDRLTVEDTLSNNNLMIAQFGTMRVLVEGYPTKGLGKGKILPKDQLWKVGEPLKSDATGHNLKGCYTITPEAAPKKPAEKK